jgi:hypothetical protein
MVIWYGIFAIDAFGLRISSLVDDVSASHGEGREHLNVAVQVPRIRCMNRLPLPMQLSELFGKLLHCYSSIFISSSELMVQ